MKKMFNYTVTKDTQFAVLGLGKFGISVVKELVETGQNVFCCDTDAKVVNELSNIVQDIVQADAKNDEFLDKVGIGNFDIVIVSFSRNFEDSLLTTLKLKDRGVPVVIVKATDEKHKQILEKIGADYVILPEVVMGERLAHSLVHNDPLMQIHDSDDFDIIEMTPRRSWLNKSLSELQLTNTENINVLGIIRDEKLLRQVDSSTVILDGDELIVIKNLT